MSNSNKTVVFIISDVRSGSTWLSYVLGSHSDSVHLGEYYRPFTMENHIACRLCQAKGKSECDYLKGIKKVDNKEAFDFAFNRFKKNRLIDCSKQMDWIKNFINNQNFQSKIIHLHRDPRAFIASQKRRSPELNIQETVTGWVKTNTQIEQELKLLNTNYTRAFYDELCIKPELYFAEQLSLFLEKPFENSSLQYWQKEHHGLGGNGAAFNNLSRFSDAMVNTGDDDYYKKMNHQLFYDSRWIDELSDKEKE
ncbi:MAG: sulfotransferase, partial [Marinicellaceae bacterium]